MKAVPRMPPPGLTTRAAVPRAGQIVGERYRLEEFLESGAMGNVWRAQQVRLRSPAAIKFLDPSLIQVPEMLERFLQEARSAAAVQSAHVIQVFDYGNHGGLPYIAMELLEGENLASRLAARGTLTPDEVGKIVSEVARGLGQAHALGVVHRDVKPGNIFLAREGKHEVTKLIDFGIAKVKADALRASQIVGTDLGMVMGTPQYMSPEQMRGWAVDHRTDLWALAVIACECLTGRCPFSGTTLADLTVQICTEQPIAPSALGEVPPGFDQWFFKGTHKDPGERFDSASEMADALESVLAPVTVRKRTRRWTPLGRELQYAWAATSRRLQRASLSAFDGAAGAAARCTALLGTLHGMTRSTVRRLSLRPGAWGWLAAAVALALVIAGVSQLARPERRTPGAEVSRETRAVLPAAALPTALPSGALPSDALPAAAAAPPQPTAQPAQRAGARATPPILTPEDLPLASGAEGAPAPPATSARAAERISARPDADPAEGHGDSPPPSAMSEAMVKLGAQIAQGGEKKAAVRSGGAARAGERGRAAGGTGKAK